MCIVVHVCACVQRPNSGVFPQRAGMFFAGHPGSAGITSTGQYVGLSYMVLGISLDPGAGSANRVVFPAPDNF